MVEHEATGDLPRLRPNGTQKLQENHIFNHKLKMCRMVEDLTRYLNVPFEMLFPVNIKQSLPCLCLCGKFERQLLAMMLYMTEEYIDQLLMKIRCTAQVYQEIDQ